MCLLGLRRQTRLLFRKVCVSPRESPVYEKWCMSRQATRVVALLIIGFPCNLSYRETIAALGLVASVLGPRRKPLSCVLCGT